MIEEETTGANPRDYPDLLALDSHAEDALIDCICAATGIHPDDLVGDDWPLERLIARLAVDYSEMRHVCNDAYHIVRTFPVDRAWTAEEAALAASSATLTDRLGDPVVLALDGGR